MPEPSRGSSASLSPFLFAATRSTNSDHNEFRVASLKDGASSRSRLSRLLRWHFEKAGCLGKPTIGAEATKAATLHEHSTLSIVHRPKKQSLIVMFKEAVVSEVRAGESLLGLSDAGDEFLYAMSLGSWIRVEYIVADAASEKFLAL
jgi:hypothetical protein